MCVCRIAPNVFWYDVWDAQMEAEGQFPAKLNAVMDTTHAFIVLHYAAPHITLHNISF